MDSLIIITIVLIILFFWLILLTFLYLKSIRHYRKLNVSDKGSLDEAINTIFHGMEKLHQLISVIEKRMTTVEKHSEFNIQKFFLKRFNPFGDTGGNQSFSLVLLDGNNDGVVLSSLHGRSGTRIYAKPVKSKKHVDYEFSEEETEVINLAVKEK